MKIKLLLVGLMISAYSATVVAEDAYMKFSLIQMDVEDSGTSANPKGLAFNIGNRVSETFIIEGIFAIGSSDDQVGSFSGPVFVPGVGTVNASLTEKVKLKNILGVYAVGISKISPNADIFGKIGLVNIKLDDKLDVSFTGAANGTFSGTINGKETGLSYGFGLNFGVSPSSAISFEYIVYPDVKFTDNLLTGTSFSANVSSLQLGFRHTF